MGTRFKLTLLLTVILLIPGMTAGSEYDWQLVKDKDGIKVYLQKYWADEARAFKGVVLINSSLDSLLAVILDIKACTDWVHRCKNPLLLLKKSFSECYHYQVHKLPFPATNREFIFHSRVTRSAQTGSVSIHMKAEPDFCVINSNLCSAISNTSLVRVKHSHGHYQLDPVAQRVTRVTWTHHTNPEGHLPTWLINILVREMPYQTLQGLRKTVFQEKYQKARLVLDSQGKMVELITQN